MGTVLYNRWKVSDELWKEIEPLLPKRPPRDFSVGGRPRVADRRAMNGILFVLKTGCQWNALNATGICSSSTAHSRFQEWRQAEVFQKLWEKGLVEYDQKKGIDWSWQSMDGAINKSPLGGGKNRRKPYGSWQKRGETKFAIRG